MDKKSLVAIMVTAPVMSMFASNWDFTQGRAGYLSYTIDPTFDDGMWVSNGSLPNPTVTADGAAGTALISNLCPSITSVAQKLPQGQYNLNISAIGNAVLSYKIGSDKEVYFAETNANGTYKSKFAGETSTTDPTHMKALTAAQINQKSITLSKESNVTLKVYQVLGDNKQAQEWTVGKLVLNFQYNFQSAWSSRNNKLEALGSKQDTSNVNIKADNNGIDYPNEKLRENEIKVLKDRFAAIKNDWTADKKIVDSINPNPASDETTEQAITRLLNTFYTTVNKVTSTTTSVIDKKLEALSGELERYVTDVTTENKVAQVIAENRSNLNDFQSTTNIGTTGKPGWFKQIQDQLPADGKAFNIPSDATYANDQQKAYVDYVSKNGVANVKAAYTALQDAVKSAYSDLTNPNIDYDALVNEAKSILGQIDSFKVGFNDAKNDWTAFGYFVGAAGMAAPGILNATYLKGNPTNLAAVALSQAAVFQQIDNIGNSHGTVYTGLIKDYKADVSAIYKNNSGYTIDKGTGLVTNNPDIAGAYKNYPDANDDMLKRMADMPAVAIDFLTLINAQELALSNANTQYKNAKVVYTDASGDLVEKTVDDLKALLTSDLLKDPKKSVLGETNAKNVIKAINDVVDAYNSWGSKIQSLYNAHTLGVNETADADGNVSSVDLNSQISGTNGAVANFNAKVTAYKNVVNGLGTGAADLFDVMETLADTEAYISTELGKLYKGSNLVNRFKADVNTVKGMVNTYSTYPAKIKQSNKDWDETIAEKQAAQVITEEARKAAWAACKDVWDLPNKTAAQQALCDAFKDAKAADEAAIQAITDAQNAKLAAERELLADQAALKNSIEQGCSSIEQNVDDITTVYAPASNAVSNLNKAVKDLDEEVQDVKDGKNIIGEKYTVNGQAAYTYTKVTVSVAKDGKTTEWDYATFDTNAASFDALLQGIATSDKVAIGNTEYNCANNTEFLNAVKALNKALNNGVDPTAGATYYYALKANDLSLKVAENVTAANLEAIEALNILFNTNVNELKGINAPGIDKVTVNGNFKPGYSGYDDFTQASNCVDVTKDSHGVVTNVSLKDKDGNVIATTVGNLDQADNYMVQLAEAYQISLKTVKPVYDNYTAWRKLRNALFGKDSTNDQEIISSLDPALSQKASAALIDDATGYVQNTADPAAMQHYLNQLQGYHDDVIKEGETVTAKYKAELASTDYDSLLGAINALNKNINQVKSDCLANQQLFENLSTTVDNLSRYANTVADYITNNDEVASNRDKWLKDIKTQTEALRTLANELTASFANGAVVADNDASAKNYKGRLDAIEKALETISTTEKGEYPSVVKAANQTFLDQRGMSYEYLYAQYENGVKLVNSYVNDIDNPGYYAALVGDEEFQLTHNKLEGMYRELETFRGEYDEWFRSLTDNLVVLETFVDKSGSELLPEFKKMPSAADQKTISDQFAAYLAKAKVIRGNITKYTNDCTDNAYDVANTYYADNFTDRGAVNYQAVWNGLKNAGLTTEWTAWNEPSQVYTEMKENGMYDAYQGIIKAATGKIVKENKKGDWVPNPENSYSTTKESVKNALETLVANGNLSQYILNMDEVANLIGDLLPVAFSGVTDSQYQKNQIYTGVNNEWKAFFDSKLNTLKDYQEKAATDAGYGDLETLANAISFAQSLNAKWRVNVGPESDMNGIYTEYVNALLSNKDVAKALKDGDNYVMNIEKAQVTAELLALANTASENLDNLLADFGYHADQISLYEGLKSRIENNVNNIKESAGVPDKEAYTQNFEDIEEAIEDAYQKMYEDECTYASTVLIAKAKSALNNLTVSFGTLDDAERAIISGYQSDIDGYAADVTTQSEKDYSDDNRKALFDLEKQIADKIVEIDGQAGVDPARTDLGVSTAKFNASYENCINEIDRYLTAVNDAADSFGDYSKETAEVYANDKDGKFVVVKNDVESLRTPADADIENNSIIYTIDEYLYKLGEDSKAAKAYKAAWDKQIAQDQLYFESDELYDSYTELLDTLDENVLKAHKTVLDYTETPRFETLYDQIQKDINDPVFGLRAELEKGKEDHSFEKGEANPVSAVQTLSERYVRKTLVEAFNLMRAEKSNEIDEKVAEILANASVKDGEEWAYTYVNLDKLLADLEEQQTKLNDIKTDSIIEIAAPTEDDPDATRLTNTVEAFEGYDGLVAEVNAIMTEVDEIIDGPTGEKYLKGDVAEDGILNAADVQKLIALIGSDQQPDPDSIEGKVADVNEDGYLNISDVTALINRILSNQNHNNGALSIARYLPKESGSNTYVAAEIQGVNGMRRFAVALNNEVNFVAGQLDIVLPEGAHVAGVQLGNRANALDSYIFENDGFTRVILTSLDNAMIEGNDGTLLYIDVEGGDIQVENLIFSDKNGNAYNVTSNSASGVGIMDAVKDGVKAIYNAAGQQLNKLTKGI
ncbi:MAG: dockerin type I domain-containing protein, partial [Bacteroidales bacterium]|nr:dockerin type I domain-containing protein [Bacteroidales bacterium]